MCMCIGSSLLVGSEFVAGIARLVWSRLIAV